MSVANRIGEITTHVEDIYDTIDLNKTDISDLNKNIDNVSKSLKRTYLDMMNNGYDKVWDNWEKVTGIGSNITLNDTVKAPMKTDLLGNTEQKNVSGKNLFDYYTYPPSETKNGLTVTNNGDGTITLNGTVTQDNTRIALGLANTVKEYCAESNITHTAYYISGSIQKVSTSSARTVVRVNYNISSSWINLSLLNSSNTKISKTQEQTAYEDGWSWVLIFGEGDICNNFTIKYQLEKGDESTDWEPYTGGQPSPNPEFSQEIKNVSGENEITVMGKNKLPSIKTQTIDSITITNNEDGSYILNGTTGSNIYFDFFAGTFDSTKYNGYYLKEYNWENVSSLFGVSSTAPISYRISTSNRTSLQSLGSTSNEQIQINDNGIDLYLAIRIHGGATLNNVILKPMLVANTSDLNASYEPYISKTFPINLKSKNLFDKNTATTGKRIYSGSGEPTDATDCSCSDYIDVSGFNNVILSGTSITYSNNGAFYDNTKTYISGFNSNAIKNGLTIPNNAKYLRFSTLTTDINTTQLEENDHATSYMPYTTPYDMQLCKQDTYQDYIKRSTGKNLFDKNNANIINGFFTSDNSALRENSDARTIYIPCNANRTYTFSKLVGARFYVSYAKQTPEIGITLYNRIGANNDNTPLTITTDSDAKYLVAFIYNSTVDTTYTLQQILDTIQIEENDHATTFEPYGHQFYLHKDIGDVVLDGSDETTVSNTGTSNWYYNITKQTGINADSTAAANNAKCTHYLPILVSNSNTNQGIMLLTSGTIRIRYGTEDTATNFKTWLSTHNTKVQYVLQTPTIEVISEENYPVLYKQLSDIQDYLTSYDNQTNLLVTADNLPIVLNATALKNIE